MAATGLVWTISPADLGGRVVDHGRGVREQVATNMGVVGERMLGYARSEHPWQNQTGAAEAGLFTETGVAGDTVTTTLGHGVAHGLFLELMQAGRYGVIPAALEAHYALVRQALIRALAREGIG